MKVIQPENCGTCDNITIHNEPICDVFNLPINVYEHTTMDYGCDSWVDNESVPVLPKCIKIRGREYILWDTQYSESNAEFAATVIVGRVPRSIPEIVMLNVHEPVYGVYVKKDLAD